MLKILLVYDDFQELTAVELMLKKIGFDVVGVTSEFSLAEQLLSFNPQVVVAQGKTAKVSTANVGRRLRESLRWDGQSVLIFYPHLKPQPQELLKIRMDVGLEYPVEPTKMVQVLAQLGNLDSNQMLDKLIKSMAHEGQAAEDQVQKQNAIAAQQSIYVGGGQSETADQKNVGGAAGTKEQAVNLKSATPESAPATAVKNSEANTAANKPLFPLSAKDQRSDNFGVNGALSNSEDPLNLNGALGVNPFQLDSSVAQDPLMQELENLLGKKTDFSLNPPIEDKARHKKYEEYMKTIPIQELSSIKKRDAKARLKDLVKDIDKSEFLNQDVSRREFVSALFKKEE